MDSNQIIDAIGGTVAAAKLCETSPAAVSQWRKNGIPKARLMYLQAVRPGIFLPPPVTCEQEKAEAA